MAELGSKTLFFPTFDMWKIMIFSDFLSDFGGKVSRIYDFSRVYLVKSQSGTSKSVKHVNFKMKQRVPDNNLSEIHSHNFPHQATEKFSIKLSLKKHDILGKFFFFKKTPQKLKISNLRQNAQKHHKAS